MSDRKPEQMSRMVVRQQNHSHPLYVVLMTDSPTAEEIEGARHECQDYARQQSMVYQGSAFMVTEHVLGLAAGAAGRNRDKFIRGANFGSRDLIG